MLSRNEYDRLIKVFLVELNHLCLNMTDNDVRSSSGLSRELENYLSDLRDPNNDSGQTLYNAFAFVDEYCGANWEAVASAGYEAYKLDQLKGDDKTSDSR